MATSMYLHLSEEEYEMMLMCKLKMAQQEGRELSWKEAVVKAFKEWEEGLDRRDFKKWEQRYGRK